MSEQTANGTAAMSAAADGRKEGEVNLVKDEATGEMVSKRWAERARESRLLTADRDQRAQEAVEAARKGRPEGGKEGGRGWTRRPGSEPR